MGPIEGLLGPLPPPGDPEELGLVAGVGPLEHPVEVRQAPESPLVTHHSYFVNMPLFGLQSL